MKKKKKRITIPKEIQSEALFRNDHKCCRCHKGPEEGRRLQIHHINKDPSDNRLENLAVLCDDCHNLLQDKQFMGVGFSEEEIRKYKTFWEEAFSEKRKHFKFPAASVKENISEKVFLKGKIIERNIEREITYTNGLAPEAFGVTTPVKLSPHKELLLQEARKIIETKKETEKLLPIFEELKRTEEIIIEDMVVLSRICLSIGDLKFQDNDFSIAEIFYKEALNYAKTAKESKIIGISLYELGAAVGIQGRNKEALGYFNEVIKINKNDHNAWFNKSVSLAFLNRNRESISACKKAIEFGTKAEKWGTVASSYYNMGNAQGKLGNYQDAVDTYVKAIEFGTKAEKWGTVASSYSNMGIDQGKLGNYQDAVDSYVKAIEFGTKAADWDTVAGAYYNMGNAQCKLGNYQEAVDNCVKAIEFGTKAADWGTVASAYYNMGYAQCKLGNYQDAVENYVKAIEFGTKAADWGTVAGAYYNMGYAQGELGNYQDAVDNYVKAIDFGTKAADWGTVAGAYSNMGYAQGELGNYREAFDSCVKAIDFGTKAEDWGTVARAYSNKGNAQGELGENGDAVDNYVKAIEFGTKAADWGTVAIAYSNMGNYQSELGNYQDAVDTYFKAIEFRNFLPGSGERIFPVITKNICILVMENNKKNSRKKANDLANKLAQVYLDGKKDKLEKLILESIQKFGSKLGKKEKSAFNKFKLLFEKLIK